MKTAILSLPNELLLMIVSSLTPFDCLCFALTCRTLYAVVPVTPETWAGLRPKLVRRQNVVHPPLYMAHDDEDRFRLLRMLEKNELYSSHVLCHFCRILHPIRTLERSQRTGCIWDELTGPKWWNLARLPFRHVWEAGHGAPGGLESAALSSRPRGKSNYPFSIPTLSVSTDWQRWPAAVPDSQEQRYVKLDVQVVVRGAREVLLRSTQRLWIPTTCRSKTANLINSRPGTKHGFQICRHQKSYLQDIHSHAPAHNSTDTNENPDDWLPDIQSPLTEPQIDRVVEAHWRTIHHLPTLQKHRRLVNPDYPFDEPDSEYRYHQFQNELTSSWSCRLCPTTAQLTTLDHSSKGIEFVLDVWQNLGSCRTPDSRLWHSCWGIYQLLPSQLPQRSTSHVTLDESRSNPNVRWNKQSPYWQQYFNHLSDEWHGPASTQAALENTLAAWDELSPLWGPAFAESGQSGLDHPSAEKVLGRRTDNMSCPSDIDT